MPARILIIEDNPANLELMSYLLKAFGHTALAASDGEEGLRTAGRELPDLIVCDVQMPRMDGYEVARRAKADPVLQKIPLIAVTAFAMGGDRARALAAGFDGYMAKPIDPTAFVQQVETYLPAGLHSATRTVSVETAPAAAISRPGGRTILVLDNEQSNLDLATNIFEHAGYTVITALNAGRALALARQAPPHVIVSDVCMPDGSGFDFITEVKADARLSRIPFVFVTSTAMTVQERAKGLALGAAKYLFRPLEPQKLLEEIEACIPERKQP